jgi:SAM-dependent methyltransferase
VRFEDRPFSSNAHFTSAALETGLEFAIVTSGIMVDVGCADGLLLKAFAEARPGWDCIGTDISAPNIELTAKNVSHMANARAILLDVTVDPLPEADVIIANSVFHLVQNPDVGLSAVGRALRPGGVAVISVPDRRRVNVWLIRSRKFLLALGLGRFLEHPRALQRSHIDRLAYLTVIPSVDDRGVIDLLTNHECTLEGVRAMERTHPLQPGHTLITVMKKGSAAHEE